MKLIKTATALTTSYDTPVTDWTSDAFFVGGASKVSVALDINYIATSFTLTLRVQSKVKSAPDDLRVTYDQWHDVFKVSGGTGSSDDVAISVTADKKVIVPLSVEHHEEIRIIAKASDITGGPTLAAYIMGNWIQPVRQGGKNNL